MDLATAPLGSPDVDNDGGPLELTLEPSASVAMLGGDLALAGAAKARATRPEQPLDWSDSGDNSTARDEDFVAPAQGPSLSYERKIRLHKYAENRARSCMGLLADSSKVLWKLHDSKGDVGVYKPSSDWSEFVSAKAVVRANAAFPNVLKTIYDLKTSEKFKVFMRKVFGDMFLDAEVLEDLNGTGVYPSANPPRDVREVYKQAAIKWWAIKSGTLASKSTDFYVLEVSTCANNSLALLPAISWCSLVSAVHWHRDGSRRDRRVLPLPRVARRGRRHAAHPSEQPRALAV